MYLLSSCLYTKDVRDVRDVPVTVEPTFIQAAQYKCDILTIIKFAWRRTKMSKAEPKS